MVGFLQRFSALTMSIIAVVIITLVFCVNLALRSNISPGLEVQSSSLQDSSHIWRNAFGIPHVTAANEHDLFFSMGFVHAQDRLWQMDLLRRIARGQTARIFGTRTLEADKFFRVLGISGIADRLAKTVSRPSKACLEAYAQGVNCFIDRNRNALPFEFDALGYQPEPWKPSDCLAIERLMAFDMSMSFWTDIAIGEIADTLGVQEALKFVPSYPAGSPTVVDVGRTSNTDSTHKSLSYTHAQSSLLSSYASAMRTVREQLNMSGMCAGSNCWVMQKDEQKRDGLIFANDPHLSLGLPPHWYQIHLSCPQINAVGCSVPGIPGIISGRNDHIAWGITNVMLDDCDYFMEKVDPKNTQYYYNSAGQRVKFRHVRDTIDVKDSAGITHLVFDYRATDRSAIVSDFHATRSGDSLFHYPATSQSLATRYVLSFSWTAQEQSDEILTALKIMKADSWKDFNEAVATWGSPALNFTYADESGTMAVAPSGIIPIRGDGDPNLPHPGWDPSYAWKGTRPASAFPRLVNPARRFVFSANNMTGRNVGFYVSSLWEPPSRAERIEEMLLEYHEYTIRDAQFMQLDLVSRNAKTLLRLSLPAVLRDSNSYSPEQREALNVLLRWDATMTPQDIAPSIYTVFQERLMHTVFCQHISPSLYKKYAFVGSLPMRKINEILADTASSWFGTDQYAAKQRMNVLIVASFKEAVQYLDQRFGPDMHRWTYGQLHTLRLKHPLDDVAALRSVVSFSVPNIGGDATTLNNALWQVHNPFDVYVGASMRFVCDLQDSVIYTVLPGGSSGQPLDAHYSDQIHLWSNGGYIPLSISRVPSTGFTLFASLGPAH